MNATHPNAPRERSASLPFSLEAEESVVGGILLHPTAFNKVAEFLQPDDFHHPALRAVYEAMLELERFSKPIDSLTVAEQMKALGTLEKLRAFNGTDYFTELQCKVVTVENIEYHGRIVRGKATARRLVQACASIAAQGYGEYGEVDDFIDQAERSIFEIAQRSMKSSFEPLKPILRTTIKSIHKRYERREVVTGVPTGFTDFDNLTCGLQPGDLIIIAARPSMGKTALCLKIVEHAAVECQIPGLIFSLEMGKESLVERILSGRALVDGARLRRGLLDQRDWVALTKAASDVSEAPIFIDESGSPTVLEIRAKARRWRSDPRLFPVDKPEQLGIIVIDYLQLIQGRASKDDNRQREVAEVSRSLKALAKELRVPVVALSQLNRSLENREDKRPKMSDLRESGALEQDSDLIAFIYRDEVYSKDQCKLEDRGVAEIIIGKQRNGPTDTVRLAFRKSFTRFENLARGRE